MNELAREVDDVEEMMDDIRESMDVSREISESLARPLGLGLSGFDDDELERELEALEEEGETDLDNCALVNFIDRSSVDVY